MLTKLRKVFELLPVFQGYNDLAIEELEKARDKVEKEFKRVFNKATTFEYWAIPVGPEKVIPSGLIEALRDINHILAEKEKKYGDEITPLKEIIFKRVDLYATFGEAGIKGSVFARLHPKLLAFSINPIQVVFGFAIETPFLAFKKELPTGFFYITQDSERDRIIFRSLYTNKQVKIENVVLTALGVVKKTTEKSAKLTEEGIVAPEEAIQRFIPSLAVLSQYLKF